MGAPLAGMESWIAELVRAEVRKAIAEEHAAPKYMSVAEAAQHARVSPATVRRWVSTQRLKSYGAGRRVRVSFVELENLMTGKGPRIARSHQISKAAPEDPEAFATRQFQAELERRQKSR